MDFKSKGEMVEHQVRKLQVQPFNKLSLDEVLNFALQNPVRPFHSRSLLTRFLTQLTSSDDLVYDVHDGEKRVGVSVLLDQVANPIGAANLEIMGRHPSVSADDLFESILSKLPLGLPIQISTHESLNPSSKTLEKFGFDFYYYSYEMKKSDVLAPVVEEETTIIFEPLSLQSYDAFYKVLVSSFKENLETSIPPIDEMKENFRKRTQAKRGGTTLLVLDGKIVGFCSVIQDEADAKLGEVHMIGVLPESRGKGFGAVALSKAISELAKLGCEKCHLAVAAQNQSALNLYQRFGFHIDQIYTSYLRK